jgi:hypothetical protein
MSRVKHNAVHQFTAGLNNAPTNNPASVLPFTHPVFQGWKVYYEQLTDGAVRVDDAYWEITSLTTGTIVAGGENSLTLGAQAVTDNSGYIVQRDLADIQVSAATKKFYLETIVKLTNASGTQAANEWFVGWCNDERATNANGAAWDFADGFGFGQLDAGTPVFVTNSSDSEQSIALSGALTTAVYRKYACYFDGTNYNLYEDDVLIAQTPASPAVVADAPLCFQVMYSSGEAKTNVFDIQYALLAVEL